MVTVTKYMYPIVTGSFIGTNQVDERLSSNTIGQCTGTNAADAHPVSHCHEKKPTVPNCNFLFCIHSYWIVNKRVFSDKLQAKTDVVRIYRDPGLNWQ